MKINKKMTASLIALALGGVIGVSATTNKVSADPATIVNGTTATASQVATIDPADVNVLIKTKTSYANGRLTISGTVPAQAATMNRVSVAYGSTADTANEAGTIKVKPNGTFEGTFKFSGYGNFYLTGVDNTGDAVAKATITAKNYASPETSTVTAKKNNKTQELRVSTIANPKATVYALSANKKKVLAKVASQGSFKSTVLYIPYKKINGQNHIYLAQKLPKQKLSQGRYVKFATVKASSKAKTYAHKSPAISGYSYKGDDKNGETFTIHAQKGAVIRAYVGGKVVAKATSKGASKSTTLKLSAKVLRATKDTHFYVTQQLPGMAESKKTAAKINHIKAAKKSAKKASKKSAKKTSKKAAKKSSKKASKKAVKKSAKKANKKAAKKTSKKAVKKAAKKSSKKANKKAVKKSAKKTPVISHYSYKGDDRNGETLTIKAKKGTVIRAYIGNKVVARTTAKSSKATTLKISGKALRSTKANHFYVTQQASGKAESKKTALRIFHIKAKKSAKKANKKAVKKSAKKAAKKSAKKTNKKTNKKTAKKSAKKASKKAVKKNAKKAKKSSKKANHAKKSANKKAAHKANK